MKKTKKSLVIVLSMITLIFINSFNVDAIITHKEILSQLVAVDTKG